MDVNNQRIWHILPLFVIILFLNTSALAQRGFYARDSFGSRDGIHASLNVKRHSPVISV